MDCMEQACLPEIGCGSVASVGTVVVVVTDFTVTTELLQSKLVVCNIVGTGDK